MKTIEVFDPAMCCSTGVCGNDVDPALVRFASDLEWLAGQGISVRRYNLAQEPGEFAGRPLVAAALQNKGGATLPLILVDGTAVSEGQLPPRSQLAEWVGVEAPSELHTADPLLGSAAAPRSATQLPVVESCCGGGAAGSGCC